jgi:hypothetical protein
MQDNFDYTGFLSKNKLGPYAKTKALNENYIDLRPINEFVEENQQEDEDGDQVTNAPTEPQPIEVVSMGSNGAVIKVRKPNGEEEDVEFELGPEIEEVDPPYGYEGTIYGEIDGVEYGIAVSLVDMGGAGYDMDLSYDGLMFVEGAGPGNQQEDEDGDQVYEDEAKGSGDNGYDAFLRALTPIMDLVKKGIITEDEKDKIINACVPVFTRLKGDQ